MLLYSVTLFEGGTIQVEHDATTTEAFLGALTGDGFIVVDEVGQAGVHRRVGITSRNVASVTMKAEIGRVL